MVRVFSIIMLFYIRVAKYAKMPHILIYRGKITPLVINILTTYIGCREGLSTFLKTTPLNTKLMGLGFNTAW